jgi:ClpX C4-type zinc finger
LREGRKSANIHLTSGVIWGIPVYGGDITDRLDRLGDQIMPAKREQIEPEIAKRIPRPTPAEYEDIARRCAQMLDKDQVEAMIKTWKGWKAEIAKRIPRPTSAEYKDIARRCAQSLGSEWIGDRMQAALQDEAEQVGNLAQSARDALEPPMHCNFCGKDQLEAMIKTWKRWYICSECVDRHTALLAKHRSQSPL